MLSQKVYGFCNQRLFNSIKIVQFVTLPILTRMAHTDFKPPNYDDIRRDSVKCPDVKSSASADARRFTSAAVTLVATLGALYGAKSVMRHFIMSMSASKEVLAMSKIEIKLGEIPEGKNATYKWRGKPLFVRHRTQDEIDMARAVDISILRDPQTDEDRVQKPQWLVVIGICTHLGCVPMAGLGDFGGYYCPCHGSHFDTAGRVRKGPAPLNLEVPVHEFVDEETLIVG
ncbi:cytochrome b-c1 complex subunit Rieske, mitochondrial-like [Onthophagus taurus]|uniref:cytochrome b-c1 complex subunit Rieske, mitochondrial-like n=1 Tax=Onthophagus taurus TaxID=166361 RepID=UPI000C209FF3|nr:cytochrome b-c1 complex subunit Rieske, mitochondrial-like [Onthophagus taurus]